MSRYWNAEQGRWVDWHPEDPMCPECAAGKHANCDGTAWSEQVDERVLCHCDLLEHGRAVTA